jgi:hypothetical protein
MKWFAINVIISLDFQNIFLPCRKGRMDIALYYIIPGRPNFPERWNPYGMGVSSFPVQRNNF